MRRRRLRLGAAGPRARRRRRGAGGRRVARRRATAYRPWSGPSRPSGSVPGGCSTSARPASCSRASRRPSEVQAAIAHLRYPPLGDSGVATYNRACDFGLGPTRWTAPTTRSSGSCRSRRARTVERRGDRRARGVDVLFVGPRDLTRARRARADRRAGVPRRAGARAGRSAATAGVAAGVLAGGREAAEATSPRGSASSPSARTRRFVASASARPASPYHSNWEEMPCHARRR